MSTPTPSPEPNLPRDGERPPVPRPAPRLPALVLVLFLLAPIVVSPELRAQASVGFTAPGSGMQLAPDRREQLDRAIEQARWNLGPVRIQPWIGIRNAGYRDNVVTAEGEETDDVTATGGAGLKLYLPFARGDGVLAGYGTPEYTWWNELDERNELRGRYGLGLFTFLGRLQLEATSEWSEDYEIATAELLDRIPVERTRTRLGAQVEITSAVAVAGSADLEEVDHQIDEGFAGPALAAFRLDQETTRFRGSVRYLLRGENGHVGLGVQTEETDFDATDIRDNEGESLFAEARLRGNRIDLDLTAVQRDLEASAGSQFPGFEETTGSAALRLHPGWRFDVQLYASRDLRYSLVDAAGFFQEDRQGLGIRSEVTSRAELLVFYEIGENDFGIDTGAREILERPDEDLTAWGAQTGLRIGESLSVVFGVRQTEIDSPRPELDRELQEILLSVNLGELTLGRGGAAW